MKTAPLAWLCVLLLFPCLTRGQAYDLIPADRVPPAGWVEATWADPGGWTTINVTTAGLPSNDPTVDAAAKINNILNARPTGQRTKLYFPTGTYYLHSRPTFAVSDVWITGDGAGNTVFRFAGTNAAGFQFKGTDTTTLVDLTADAARGAASVRIPATNTLFANGDFIEIDQGNSGIYGDYPLGQITRIASAPYVSGTDRVLPLEMKLGLPFPLTKLPRVRKLNLISNLRIDHLTIDRTGATNSGNNIYIGYAYNVAIEAVHSIYGAPNHIDFSHCYRVVCTRNTLELATAYGKGGQGYGFTPKHNSTWGMIKECVIRKLRHCIVPELGANHFIISQNTFSENLAVTGTIAAVTLHGWGAHNNLVQHNYAADPGGRSIEQDGVHDENFHNAFLRNYATAYIGDVSLFEAEYATIVGNKVLAGGANAMIKNHGDGDRSNYWAENHAFTKYEAEDYTAVSGVTVAACNDAYEGQLLTSTSTNDWVAYANVDLTHADSISIRHCVGVGNSGAIELRLGSPTGTLIGSAATSSTGGWGKGWRFLEIPITASPGSHTLYMKFIATAGIVAQINFFTVNKRSTSSTTVQGEDFAAMSSVAMVSCSEGGNAIGSLDNGSWAAYSNLDLSGASYLDVRYACGTTGGGTIEVRLGSSTGTKIGELVTTSTGGWDANYRTAKAFIKPTSGIHTIYLVFVTSNAAVANINYFKVMRPLPFIDNSATL